MLTRIGETKPRRLGHDITPGVSASFVAVPRWVVGQHVCQGENIANQPYQHDSHDDLLRAKNISYVHVNIYAWRVVESSVVLETF